MNSSKTTMAGGLLLGVVMSLCAPACLLPQDGTVLPIVDSSTPPKKDHVPRIERATPGDQLTLNSTCPAPFQVVVTDEDEGDHIRSLWFIDPNSEFTTATNSPAPTPGSQQIVMGGGVTIDEPMGLDALYQFAVNSTHRLTVVVSDGEFLSPGEPIGGQRDGIEVAPHSTFMLPDGGGCGDAGFCTDPSGTVSYTWTIVIAATCQ